jgi:hypothetical protein
MLAPPRILREAGDGGVEIMGMWRLSVRGGAGEGRRSSKWSP